MEVRRRVRLFVCMYVNAAATTRRHTRDHAWFMRRPWSHTHRPATTVEASNPEPGVSRDPFLETSPLQLEGVVEIRRFPDNVRAAVALLVPRVVHEARDKDSLVEV